MWLMDEEQIKDCRHELEMRILRLESDILRQIEAVRIEMKAARDDQSELRAGLKELLTRIEFEPYRKLTVGAAAGIGLAAVATFTSRILGWG
jgi:hypothetical protein